MESQDFGPIYGSGVVYLGGDSVGYLYSKDVDRVRYLKNESRYYDRVSRESTSEIRRLLKLARRCKDGSKRQTEHYAAIAELQRINKTANDNYVKCYRDTLALESELTATHSYWYVSAIHNALNRERIALDSQRKAC